MSDIFKNANEGGIKAKREERLKRQERQERLNEQEKIKVEKLPKLKKIELPTKNFNGLWKGINNETVYSVMRQQTPTICLATLSLYRYQHLFKTLDHNPNVMKTPLNICLRVQAAEEMPLKYKTKVLELLEKNFVAYDVQFTYKNHGSGVPRRDVVHRALEHFGTDFVMTLDDDIILPPFALEVLSAILIDHPKLGSISLACHPNSIIWKRRGDSLVIERPREVFCRADAMGSGTTMIRKEVFKTCDLDPKYYIGWGDMDFGTQMRKAGWELGVLNAPGFKAINPPEKELRYKKIRHNSEHTRRSWQRYKDKWGITIKG